MRAWLRDLARRLRATSATRQISRTRTKRRRPALWLELLEDRVVPSLSSPLNQLLPTGQTPIDVQLGVFGDETSNGVAILGANGSLTTALNGGANGWRDPQTVDLGIGPANGMVLGF